MGYRGNIVEDVVMSAKGRVYLYKNGNVEYVRDLSDNWASHDSLDHMEYGTLWEYICVDREGKYCFVEKEVEREAL